METIDLDNLETLDLEKLFPDLFEGLSAEQIREINNSWAYQWHEGWRPNQEDVAQSLLLATSAMSDEEYLAMLHEKVRKAKASETLDIA